jgi:hypothetical protein
MFTLDFSRSSELESLLRAGIGFHLWHKALLINPGRTFGRGCKSNNSCLQNTVSLIELRRISSKKLRFPIFWNFNRLAPQQLILL